jgi:hypothetical protein
MRLWYGLWKAGRGAGRVKQIGDVVWLGRRDNVCRYLLRLEVVEYVADIDCKTAVSQAFYPVIVPRVGKDDRGITC